MPHRRSALWCYAIIVALLCAVAAATSSGGDSARQLGRPRLRRERRPPPTIGEDVSRAREFAAKVSTKLSRHRDALSSAINAKLGKWLPAKPGAAAGGRGGAGGSNDGALISGLEARAWAALADDPKVWGKPVASTKGPGGGTITAWKHWLPAGTPGSANSVVKARGLVRATPSEIFFLVFDSQRTKEYNTYSAGRTDVATLGPLSKVVWNRTCPPGTTKQHDFCTLMHGWENPKNGTALLVTQAMAHDAAKPSATYHRSKILLGANHMRLVGPRLTELTTVTHVASAGVPAWVADKFAASSAMDFVKAVDKALNKDVDSTNDSWVCGAGIGTGGRGLMPAIGAAAISPKAISPQAAVGSPAGKCLAAKTTVATSKQSSKVNVVKRQWPVRFGVSASWNHRR